ncbi:TRAP transporter permease [Vannielia litorea]|uniref:TRAP transporter permease n=1 Tax=Vannielia litorea TaxID=1217970 RepID=UPI001C93B97C|nr:TRAP transporter fused permease subunit [Vannielia litorea]MBY6048758.1 TRAP transporter fused permease subunit [Vannielia litorea]MBY6076172.1 TRAP transporter fused permease subunit [Vannielia litorea]
MSTDQTPQTSALTNEAEAAAAAAAVPQSFRDQAEERWLSMPRWVRALVLAMSASGVALSVAYIFAIVPMLDLTYYFLLMAAFLPVVYLLLPAWTSEDRVTWASYLPAIAICGLTLFMAYQARGLVFGTWVPVKETWQLVVASAIFLLILEAARRSGGYIFLVIVIALALYPVYAFFMPGILWGPPTTLSRTIAFNVFSGDAMLGVVTRVVGELIIGFLILAALMVATGAADFFLNLAMALMGTSRGGAAKVSVLASGFFGSLSGSIFGNVVSTGSVTIPSMKKAGFPGHYAGALEACASTGGMLMPPVMGAVAFIMADFTNTEYRVIVLAALIPSLLYYFGLYCHVDGFAARNGLKGLKRADLPRVAAVLKDGWPFLVVLAFLVWGLVFMRWERLTPFYASALLLVLTTLHPRLRIRPNRIPELFYQITKLLSQTMGLLLPTSFILGGLMATGVAPVIAASLVRMGGDGLVPVLAIGIGVCLIFGMLGMIVAAYLMLALTLAPALEQIAGLNTLAIHLFIAYYASLAAITPPVALAAFLASRISDSDPIKTSVHAARLGIVLYFVPIFFLFEPALILQGPFYLTVIWTALNILAVITIAAASEGYVPWRGRLAGWARWPLFGCGLIIGFPEWSSTAIGLALAAALVLLGSRAEARDAPASAT